MDDKEMVMELMYWELRLRMCKERHYVELDHVDCGCISQLLQIVIDRYREDKNV